MKMLTVIAALLFSAISAATEITSYSVRCECFTLGQFEAVGIWVVETINGEENWYRLDTRHYDPDTCEVAIQNDKTCQSFVGRTSPFLTH